MNTDDNHHKNERFVIRVKMTKRLKSNDEAFLFGNPKFRIKLVFFFT